MLTSQNGWIASPNKAAIGIISPSVAGVDFPQGVRGGDVATVLMYVAEQFHQHVEKLVDGWCWGYFYRVIDGSSTLSNHASGTAVDLNAPRHPRGKRYTFSVVQVAAIRRILAYCEGVIRWGGDYTRPDEMHFEINKSAGEVARIAAKIRRGLASTPSPSPLPIPVSSDWTEALIMSLPTLRRGASGSAVKRIQGLLLSHNPEFGGVSWIDGNFGPATEDATKRFQRAYGLTVDGIWGRQTWTTALTR